MPTIRTEKGYRFFFYSNEGDEPAHIHVQQGNKLAKIWLDPIAVAKSRRFSEHELNELTRIVTRRRDDFLREWNDFFDIKF